MLAAGVGVLDELQRKDGVLMPDCSCNAPKGHATYPLADVSRLGVELGARDGGEGVAVAASGFLHQRLLESPLVDCGVLGDVVPLGDAL
eukprot:3487755-Pyramimonas_sp.AAC.1